MRHPAVTGVALANVAPAAAFRKLSLKTNLTVSSMPTVPPAIPRSPEPLGYALIRILVFLPDADIGVGSVW